jgi:hypothetical protein
MRFDSVIATHLSQATLLLIARAARRKGWRSLRTATKHYRNPRSQILLSTVLLP